MSDVLDWGALLAVSIGGVDRTADLVGAGSLDRELDCAGIGTFRLARGTAVPAIGATVAISGIVAVPYAGFVSTLDYDPGAQCWVVGCTDGLQEVFEAQPTPAAILALLPAGAIWHPDLHGEFRQGWEAAQDALGTVPYSIYIESGALLAVPWAGTGYATTIAHTGGGIYDGSVRYTAARRRELIGALTATVQVRYTRLHQWTLSCSWAILDWSFCNWIARAFPLPTRQMVAETVAGNTWSLVESTGLSIGGDGLGIYTQGLPASGPQCGTIWSLIGGATDQGFVWTNVEFGTPAESIWHAAWKLARRWSQTLVETYTLVVAGPPGTIGAVLTDETASHDAPCDDTGWDASAATRLPSGVGWQGGAIHLWADVLTAADRTTVLQGMQQMMATRIRRSHRQHVLGATVEPGDEPSLGTRARLIAEDVSGTGQVSRLLTHWDCDSQAAGCDVSVIVTEGTTAGDTLAAPDAPDMSPTAGGYTLSGSLSLGTHVGGLSADPAVEPEQSDTWDGWICNVQEGIGYPVAGSQTYETGFTLITPDVPAGARDEQPGAVTHAVTIATLAGAVTFS